MSFLLCFIFQTHKACLKNGGPSMGRAQGVFQQPAKSRRRACLSDSVCYGFFRRLSASLSVE